MNLHNFYKNKLDKFSDHMCVLSIYIFKFEVKYYVILIHLSSQYPQCLMTGLMFHRPNDHIQYLIECLEKVKTKGQAAMTWNMFVEVRSAKTPLPPITPDNGKRPVSRGRTPKGNCHT